MPGGDRTGPIGRGPMTGRAAGYCAGYPAPGYGRGFGRGWGRGFGRGYWGQGRSFWWRDYPSDPYYQMSNPRDIYPVPNKEDEKGYLEDMVKGLEEEIKAMQDRIQELSKEKKEVL